MNQTKAICRGVRDVKPNIQTICTNGKHEIKLIELSESNSQFNQLVLIRIKDMLVTKD